MVKRLLFIFSFLFLSLSIWADERPVFEVKADRTIIYPQRMDLMGEESLMDILQMYPDLMIAGYEDVISGYNLRIDNCPMNGDTRLILSQMKAKDIAKVQVCENTGVAKGTIGKGRVLDVNLVEGLGISDEGLKPENIKGFAEAQMNVGKDVEGIGTVNMLYGSKSTDIYANASYRHADSHKEYLTFHMTNRFDSRNKILSYFTQQYIDAPGDGDSRKVMGRARYFHTFNDMGTELLLVGGYQYASDPIYSNKLPLYIVELNTPLFTKKLSMMLGAEGDFLKTEQKHSGRKWEVTNNDVYLQFTYSFDNWRFTAGHRSMFYHYALNELSEKKVHHANRNNTNLCLIYLPNKNNQWQLGYYKKYYNPTYASLFEDIQELSDEEWEITKGQLVERNIQEVKLGYTYSRQALTLKTDASYYKVEDSDNFMEWGGSVYWKKDWLNLTGGTNIYTSKNATYASIRFSPTAYLPNSWQIGMQMVYYTKKAPRREVTGVPVYGCVSVNKQIGRHWNMGIDWHDMFDSLKSRKTDVNRHAVNVRLQYRI